MVICTDGDWISFIQINNIKVTIDSEICLFFSEPKSFKNKLEFNRNISDLLLIKFGVPFWASALDEKFVAIKFLFTYSPILSKLMKYDNITFQGSSEEETQQNAAKALLDLYFNKGV